MASRLKPFPLAPLAILVLLGLLVISTASAMPGHWHNRPQCRKCGLCRGGHLFTLDSSPQVVVESPAPVEWRAPALELLPFFEPALIPSSPRAPPA